MCIYVLEEQISSRSDLKRRSLRLLWRRSAQQEQQQAE